MLTNYTERMRVTDRLRRFALSCVLLAASGLAYAATQAAAADYVVIGCGDPIGLSSSQHVVRPTDGWYLETPAYASGNYCGNGGGAQGLYSETAGGVASHAARWQFNAPSGTTISHLTTWYYGHLSAGSSTASPQAVFEAQQGSSWTNLAPSFGNQTSAPVDSGGAFYTSSTGSASAVRFGVRCDLAGPCASGGMPYLIVRSTGVWLTDASLPVVATSGGLVDGAYASGSTALSVHATDEGGGLYRLRIVVAGQAVVDEVPDGNAGKCATITSSLGSARHVTAPVPCSLDVARDVPVDTAALSDGAHDVVVSAEDIAGNVRSVTRSIVVDNRPPVAGTVSVTGVAEENQALTAEVAGFDGQGVAYDYRWQRCAVDGSGCVDIGGADQRTYRLTASDIGHRVRSKVLASDHGGTTVAYSDVLSGTSAHGIVANDPTNDGAGGAGGAGGNGGAGGAGSGVAVPNGDNPSRLAKVSAVVDRKGKTIATGYGKVVKITGKLVDEHGAAIRNALVEVQAVRKVPRAVPVVEGAVRTDAKGRFSYRAKASASRELRFTYRAYSTDRDLTSKASVTLLVRAAGSFKATPRALRNGHTVTFKGRLKGGLVPKGGVAVEVRVRYCLRIGSRTRCEWRLVKSVRANRRGAFTARYTFRRTTATTTYRFRAKARADSAWPFIGGVVGKGAKVTVRP